MFPEPIQHAEEVAGSGNENREAEMQADRKQAEALQALDEEQRALGKTRRTRQAISIVVGTALLVAILLAYNELVIR